MTTPNDLSDKALAVFAFAIYHQLATGEPVTAITAKDAAGHKADDAAVAELETLELAHRDGDRLVFSDAGTVMLGQLVDRLRGTW